MKSDLRSLAAPDHIDPLRGRVVIVSPHLDDAVMSLGSTIARAAHAGAKIEILTVFGDAPSSRAPASPWDRQCGFSSEGEAASARRDEDRLACSIVGAEPRWLEFGCESYERRGGEAEIFSAIVTATRHADAVLIPGFPLAHADHAFVAELLLRRGLRDQLVGLYLEQPYSYTLNAITLHPVVAPALRSVLKPPLRWARIPANRTFRRAKAMAVRAYRSQLRHLGLRNVGLHRMLWREAAQGGESIAWAPRFEHLADGFESTEPKAPTPANGDSIHGSARLS